MTAAAPSPPTVTIEFTTDRIGFPMVRLPAVAGARHRLCIGWLPISKAQFEHFIADQPGGVFDQARYDLLINVHKTGDVRKNLPGRVSPAGVNRDNYDRAFVTGIFPSEIELFLDWMNEDADGVRYELPTDQEWRSAYAVLSGTKEVNLDAAFRGLDRPSPRGLVLARTAARVAAEIREDRAVSAAEQMLMTGGLMEWVRWNRETDKPQFGARGRTHLKGLFNDRTDYCTQSTPAEPGDGLEKTRLPGFGFRLVRREYA